MKAPLLQYCGTNGIICKDFAFPADVDEVTVGRAIENMLVLFDDNLPDALKTAISRFHAKLNVMAEDRGRWTILDLKSTNGEGGRVFFR